MQDRPNNYQYNDFSSLKDPNQPGQNSSKQGKNRTTINITNKAPTKTIISMI